jgi:crotonobetainyl-CoA:carnitine CoA-transferase CaiB-like acyl-CoA transferase
MLKTMGREDLIGDERFLTNDSRVRWNDYIDELIQDWVSKYALDECLNLLNGQGIPAGPIYSIEDIMHDPHYQSRDMILEMEHEDVGRIKVPGIIPKLSKTPGKVNWLGPKLGEHNYSVLHEIGLTDEQIAKLSEKGII